jgi:hypothetical protein
LWDVCKPPTTGWGRKNDSACSNKHHQIGFVGNKLDVNQAISKTGKNIFHNFLKKRLPAFSHQLRSW